MVGGLFARGGCGKSQAESDGNAAVPPFPKRKTTMLSTRKGPFRAMSGEDITIAEFARVVAARRQGWSR